MTGRRHRQQGKFQFPERAFNPYHMTVKAAGFDAYVQDVEVRSVVPASVQVNLQVSGSSTTVMVEDKGDLVENDPTFHSDVDKELIDKLPMGKRVVVDERIVGERRRALLPIPTARSTGWSSILNEFSA